MTDEPLVLTDRPREGVARLTLNRPKARNAQNLDLIRELDEGFTGAMRDESVKVIVLAANGPDFSAGHDLRQLLDSEDADRFGAHGSAGNFSAPHHEGYMAREEEAYIATCRRCKALTNR